MKDWYSRICFLKWKVKGTPYNRILYQLAPSVPSTDGIESGLLPTASASEDGRTPKKGWTWNKTHWLDQNGKKIQSHLKHTIQMLGTPKATQSIRSNRFRKGRNPNPQEAIQMLPTPRKTDYKGASKQTEVNGRNPETNSLMDAIENGKNPGLKLQLNPAFEEWMFHLPMGYTRLKNLKKEKELRDLKPSVTQSNGK